MKAAARDRYGPLDIVELCELEKPAPSGDEVLVRVSAASVNPFDAYSVGGRPYLARAMTGLGLLKPKTNRLGADFAGTVEAVGPEVTELQAGDDVFGGARGAFAEYVIVRARKAVARKPANLTFEQAAAVPVAATTALQGLRNQGHLQAGQRVLINGASGGVGTFAVQIAKAFGAEVTGVCSTRNVDLVRSLGADHVVDYTREDFIRSGRRYDLILDNAATRSWSDYRRVLEPQATFVLVGTPKGRRRLIGPLGRMAKIIVASVRGSQRAVFLVARLDKPSLEDLRDLLEAGTVTPVIDRLYELSEVADALRYVGEGHARAKVVVTT